MPDALAADPGLLAQRLYLIDLWGSSIEAFGDAGHKQVTGKFSSEIGAD